MQVQQGRTAQRGSPLPATIATAQSSFPTTSSNTGQWPLCCCRCLSLHVIHSQYHSHPSCALLLFLFQPVSYDQIVTLNLSGDLQGPCALDLCDAYTGARDGLLGVLALICGGSSYTITAPATRSMHFFTLCLLYYNLIKGSVKDRYPWYNPALKIHASCIL